MKTPLEKQFIHCMRRRERMLADDLIALVPRFYTSSVGQLDGAKSMIFDIVDIPSGRVSGEIALRLGDGAAMYYLGHIGYHIDPPFRGKKEALRACRLCLPILAQVFPRTFVITTDDDNQPSIRTCESLGCVLECTVDVPARYVYQFNLSKRKRRYVYEPRP